MDTLSTKYGVKIKGILEGFDKGVITQNSQSGISVVAIGHPMLQLNIE